jgi:hypothetical protein
MCINVMRYGEMKKVVSKPPDGEMDDLEDHVSSMSLISKKCPQCHETLVASARREFCCNCGVWWWRRK